VSPICSSGKRNSQWYTENGRCQTGTQTFSRLHYISHQLCTRHLTCTNTITDKQYPLLAINKASTLNKDKSWTCLEKVHCVLQLRPARKVVYYNVSITILPVSLSCLRLGWGPRSKLSEIVGAKFYGAHTLWVAQIMKMGLWESWKKRTSVYSCLDPEMCITCLFARCRFCSAADIDIGKNTKIGFLYGSACVNWTAILSVTERFLARDSMLSALYAIANPSLSVCPSVTRVDQSKTVERILEILSPTDRPNILVFRHQRSLLKSDGFTPTKYKGGSKN